MSNPESFTGLEEVSSQEGVESTEQDLSPEAQEIVAKVEVELAPEISEAKQETDLAKQQGLFEKIADKFRNRALRAFTIASMAAMPYMSSSAEANEVIKVDSAAQLRAELARAQESRRAGEPVARQEVDFRRQPEVVVQTETRIVVERELDIKEIKTIEQINIKRTQLDQRIRESDARIALAQQRQDHKERMDWSKEARKDRDQAMKEIKTLNKLEIDLRNQDLKEYKTRNAEIRKNGKAIISGLGSLGKILQSKK